jgi:hypothetical protein
MNNLTKKDSELLMRLACNYGAPEGKIVEHMIISDNPLKTVLEEIQFYKPNEAFIGYLFLLVGKKLNTYMHMMPKYDKK